MSRSGYSYDLDQWDLIRWRGAVNSAIKGKRGQAFLRELLAALDAMPKKELITAELEADGAYCALGAVGAARGINMKDIDAYYRQEVAETFGIAEAMAAEIMNENDDGNCRGRETPSERWIRMRAWVVEHIQSQEQKGGDDRG